MLVFVVVLLQVLLTLLFSGCLSLMHILSHVAVADDLLTNLLFVVDIVVGFCLPAFQISYQLLASFVA